MLESLFKLREHGTNARTEILAGLTTFLTMSYIIFVNPEILGTTGMDKGAVFVATCLAAALGCLIMAFLANWPIGMAPGMGLNAFFAFGVVGAMGYSWQQALGAVFVSGVIFLILSATGIRKWLIEGIPKSLRSAIVAGIGLFLALIALKSAGIVVGNQATLVAQGDLKSPTVLLAILGFFIIVCLDSLRVKGAILIGILAVTILSALLGYSAPITSIVSAPPSIAPTFMQLDIAGVLNQGFLHIILVFVLVEIFDATGTLIGVARRANLLPEGKPNRLGRALFADSTAILAGSALGTSSTTAFVESAAGVQAGGRTGMTALIVGLLFLLCLFFAPLASVVPAYATAPALLYVAGLMVRELVEVEWNDITNAIPAALTAIIMPFTYSIAEGIAFGFISYVIIKAFTGRFREIHIATLIIALLFVLRFALE
ncbi:AGZA family xanthine/uracil permease-like MFS transporter [Advenella incenata]|uniref:AGZA family xanthine/uracil permease-like MFS transporter n=1 Tax=Advenella incenata TaxID=267800 RepID=A0A4Q7VV94_9BURK|nr:NCS2 family permease [Advenella incenata]RZU00385.1 AGZA family xanthine/uracil permease-like MFS transporter [Advenella incenata]